MRRHPRAVVLPGRAYPATGPALAPVADGLVRHGYDVGALEWSLEILPDDPADFVVSRLLEAVPARPDGRPGVDLVAGKSLGTYASAYAARHRLPAIWVTPVLTVPAVATGIRDNPAPQLVLAGLADPFHDEQVAAGLVGPHCEVVGLAGLDHALSATGDGEVAPDILVTLADAIDDFLRRYPWQA